ncbi:hypothetical protein BGY98DRAFT_204546 [Russula aff. rugulosa BPL654]|nr:hypothetical protein BGY98DRAFT_204546 [Russula aff. rugulosa BPL654]
MLNMHGRETVSEPLGQCYLWNVEEPSAESPASSSQSTPPPTPSPSPCRSLLSNSNGYMYIPRAPAPCAQTPKHLFPFWYDFGLFILPFFPLHAPRDRVSYCSVLTSTCELRQRRGNSCGPNATHVTFLQLSSAKQCPTLKESSHVGEKVCRDCYDRICIT